MTTSTRVAVAALLLAVSTMAACGTPPDRGATPTQPAHTTAMASSASDEDDEALVPDNPSVAALPLPPARPDGSCSTQRLPLPDPVCTPGVMNPDVSQATIGSTICKKGWTKTIRPPSTWTDRLKAQQIREYGYTDTDTDDYEEDHLLPLELGGAPRDPRNLWPEPHDGSLGSKDKDKIETRVRAAVCRPASTVTLQAAQQAMLSDWATALTKLGIG